ncbi:dTDP-4-dehydrorhamnose reductase [Microbacterium insulae]|uniref:dTDP-4-dehydrorhamnose reductase n=1 Tax=Microbacterium insulae TaxID=483014 RepID=A0ABW3AEH6_9MICO
MAEFGKPLRATATAIPGLTLWDLPVHGDSRGWFKESWQREKMTAAGLPDFGPVQNNISFNDAVGTTRGIHAEPWDKWVSVATGRVFGAWVDLREGPTFGAVVTAEIDPSTAVFVPRGVGNAYQTLEPDTAYAYLVNDHWSPDAEYTFLNQADPTVAIAWPIGLDRAEVSAKDRAHPKLSEVVPVSPRRVLVTGADGQLGRALRAELGEPGHIEYATRADLDLTSSDLHTARRWRDYDTIVNAAAYTAVDAAETEEGRRQAWAINVTAVSNLARIARAHRITLVHVSTDYVFDGASPLPYREDAALSPLGVYGQTKAAADAIVSSTDRHYILRTSWVIGDGRNFVQTMRALAERGVDPKVVDDQIGRLTFTTDLVRGIRHLLETGAPYGLYNLTGAGEPASWCEVARRIFALTGHDPTRVGAVSTAEYFSQAAGPVAPRPLNSVLDLTKIAATGLELGDWETGLRDSLAAQAAATGDAQPAS